MLRTETLTVNVGDVPGYGNKWIKYQVYVK